MPDASHPTYRLRLLAGELAVHKLGPGDALPESLGQTGGLVSITRTPREVSVVCPAGVLPEGAQMERGWRALEVVGPLGFELVGVLSELSGVLARAGVSIFALSTYETDYVLVKEGMLERAVEALRGAGHEAVGWG